MLNALTEILHVYLIPIVGTKPVSFGFNIYDSLFFVLGKSITLHQLKLPDPKSEKRFAHVSDSKQHFTCP